MSTLPGLIVRVAINALAYPIIRVCWTSWWSQQWKPLLLLLGGMLVHRKLSYKLQVTSPSVAMLRVNKKNTSLWEINYWSILEGFICSLFFRDWILLGKLNWLQQHLSFSNTEHETQVFECCLIISSFAPMPTSMQNLFLKGQKCFIQACYLSVCMASIFGKIVRIPSLFSLGQSWVKAKDKTLLVQRVAKERTLRAYQTGCGRCYDISMLCFI